MSYVTQLVKLHPEPQMKSLHPINWSEPEYLTRIIRECNTYDEAIHKLVSLKDGGWTFFEFDTTEGEKTAKHAIESIMNKTAIVCHCSTSLSGITHPWSVWED
jgi:hypothetical protein